MDNQLMLIKCYYFSANYEIKYNSKENGKCAIFLHVAVKDIWNIQTYKKMLIRKTVWNWESELPSVWIYDSEGLTLGWQSDLKDFPSRYSRLSFQILRLP